MLLTEPLNNYNRHTIFQIPKMGGGGMECVNPVLVSSLKLAHLCTASNWIGVQTGIHVFDSTQTFGFKNI